VNLSYNKLFLIINLDLKIRLIQENTVENVISMFQKVPIIAEIATYAYRDMTITVLGHQNASVKTTYADSTYFY